MRLIFSQRWVCRSWTTSLQHAPQIKLLPLPMEKGTGMIRCLATPETTRRVLYVFRDQPLRFQRDNLDDDDENEVEDSGEEMEEEKDNAPMIVQEIRRAIGAQKGFSFTMCLCLS
jgi:hypothetical protein